MAPGYKHRGIDELCRIARRTPLAPACDRFYFLRHGETDGNVNKVFQRADQPLNARGLAQAATAAAALASERVACIAASTMARAWATAEIVARHHRCMPEPHDGLRERWFGDLIGTPAAGYDWRLDPPNGETLATFVARAQAGLAAALAKGDSTLTVAHGGILYVLAPSLGLELEEAYYSNATPLLIERRSGGWRASMLTAPAAGGDNIV